jgi:hypothetical protein
MLDGDVVFDRRGQLQVIRVRLLAEVRRLEQFLDQDDLRAFGGGFTDQRSATSILPSRSQEQAI